MKSQTFRCIGWVMLVTFLYGAAYAVARWRKCIVLKEYVVKEQRLLVRATGPGWDFRDNWRGNLKNRLNGPVFLFFRPLTLVEDALRGYEKPLDPSFVSLTNLRSAYDARDR